ncbi:MAG: hypothetical protein AAFQ15_06875, partial [Pseudomonadota bacterium]
MIFGGLLGVWLVLFGAGSVWMARSAGAVTPAKITLFSTVSIAVAYMFETLWWMHLGVMSFGHIVALSLLILVINFVILSRASKTVELSWASVILAGLCGIAILWVLKADVRQHFAFDTWDAVVSWNRWATEFLDERYAPLSNPYPVLWPKLWSVIYISQGGEIWQLLTKNLHLVLIAFVVLISWELWRRRNAAAALVFALGLLIGTGEVLDKFTWGYMDQPVALLIGMGVIALFLSRNDKPDTRELDLIWILPFWLFGIAAITKQAGWPLIVFGLIILAYDYFKRDVDWKRTALAAFGLLAPLIVFALFFSGYKHAVMGTGAQIEGLMSLSASRTQIDDQWGRGLALFLSVESVADGVRLLGLASMSVAAVFLRGRDRLIVALTAFLAIIGSIGTGICCSYDDRNSTWLYTLSIAGLAGAVASARWPDRIKMSKAWAPISTGYETWKTRAFETRWRLDRRIFLVFIPLGLLSAAVIETGSKDYITASDNVMRNLGGNVGANALRADIERTPGCRTIFSAHTMVRENPTLADYKSDFKGGRDLNWYLRSGAAIDSKCQTYWYLKPGLYPNAA